MVSVAITNMKKIKLWFACMCCVLCGEICMFVCVLLGECKSVWRELRFQASSEFTRSIQIHSIKGSLWMPNLNGSWLLIILSFICMCVCDLSVCGTVCVVFVVCTLFWCCDRLWWALGWIIDWRLWKFDAFACRRD